MSSLSVAHPADQWLRLLQAALMRAASACGALAEALQRRRLARECLRREQLAEQLPPALLADIGAPAWLAAAAERELARERHRLDIERLGRR